jgi:hypothetical protein
VCLLVIDEAGGHINVERKGVEMIGPLKRLITNTRDSSTWRMQAINRTGE